MDTDYEDYTEHAHTALEPCGHWECRGVDCPICLDTGYVDLDYAAAIRREPCPFCRPDDHDDYEKSLLVQAAEQQQAATWTEEHDESEAA